MSILSSLQVFFFSFLFILAHFCPKISLEFQIEINWLYWKWALSLWSRMIWKEKWMKKIVKTYIRNFWITRVSIYDPRNWYGAPPVQKLCVRLVQESNERPHRATKGGWCVLIGASLQRKLWACRGEGIVHITPESKKQSLLWWHAGSLRPKIFKQTPTAHKFAATVCCESTGVVLVEFCHKGRPSALSQWSKMNARFRYCAILTFRHRVSCI